MFTNKSALHYNTQLLMGSTSHHHFARSVNRQPPPPLDCMMMMSQRALPTAGGPRLPPGTAGGPRRAPSTADRIMSRRISSGLKPIFPRTPRRPGRQGGIRAQSRVPYSKDQWRDSDFSDGDLQSWQSSAAENLLGPQWSDWSKSRWGL